MAGQTVSRWGGRCRARASGRASLRRAGAFTLAELLVVIIIIGLLTAILVPFLGGTTEQSYKTICQHNLQQIAQALGTEAAKGAIGSGALPRLSTGPSWYGSAMVNGSPEMLECPKESFRISGGASPKQWFTPIDPPPSARFDEHLEHAKEIRFWKEREAYRLPSSVTVDIHEPGFYNKGNQWKSNRKQIPAGTVVDIWFCHYDNVGKSSATSEGAVTFEYEVLGLIVEDDTLDASDNTCGYPGTVYHGGRKARGFEDNGAERLTFEDDRRTVVVDRFQISSPGEEIRFLVSTPATSGGRHLRCSYGMSNLVAPEMTSPDQVMIVEYDKLVADVNGDAYDHDLDVHLRPRHFDKVNTLFVDGQVRLMPVDELMTERNKPTELWHR